MAAEPSEQERAQVAAELRRVREGVQERALLERAPGQVLPAPRELKDPQAVAPAAEPAVPAPPPRPDDSALHAQWRTSETALGRLGRVVRRLLSPLLRAQEQWNARQAQFDTALLDYVEARLAHTHAHYDTVLGVHGRHMGEIDERHLILQEELVAHVHDLVRRVDLVLAEGERGRVGLEFALRDLRVRLLRLEERLSGAGGVAARG